MWHGPHAENKNSTLEGYEIHSGRTTLERGAKRAFRVLEDDDDGEGCVAENGMVFGTYLHGLFEQDQFRRDFVNGLRKIKGLKPIEGPLISSKEKRISAFDRLADTVEANIDSKLLEKLAGLKGVLG